MALEKNKHTEKQILVKQNCAGKMMQKKCTQYSVMLYTKLYIYGTNVHLRDKNLDKYYLSSHTNNSN